MATITISAMTHEPATDDEIRQYLQGEIQALLARCGIAWLEQPLQAAIDEREELDPLTAPQRETIAEARRLIHDGADQKLSWQKWSEALDDMDRVREQLLAWGLPGAPGSRARDLQHAIDDVISAIEAAELQPGERDWNEWTGYDDYTAVLLQQPWYQPWLEQALDAWQAGEDIAIEDNKLLIVTDDLDED